MVKREAPESIWKTVDKLLNGDPVRPSEREAAQAYFEQKASQAQNEWNLYCHQFGLLTTDFGRTFKHRSSTFTVIGIKPRSPKYPVLAQNTRGKVYKFPAYFLTDAIGRI